MKDLISSNVFPRVLRSNLAWPLYARFDRVGHRSAVRAGTLAVRCHGLGILGQQTTLMVCINGLLLPRLLLPLMMENFGSIALIRRRLLVHVPGRILDELRHMLQVDLFDTIA